MKLGGKNRQTPGYASPARLLEACRLLAESGAKYLIIGGVAASLHGIARGTKDLDILIPKDIENAAKILSALSKLTWGIAGEMEPAEVVAKPFTIIGDMPRVDLLTHAGKMSFESAYKNRMEQTIDGVKFPYLNLEDLIRSKETGRPRDQVDIEELRALGSKKHR